LAPPTEAEWKYVSVRRTFIFLEHSAGTVNVVVGFAPMKPAEFVVLRIGLKAAREDPDP
jgi:phage tail sheath protein FI